MMRLAATLMLCAASGCATVPPANAEDPMDQTTAVGQESGSACDAAPARDLIGRPATQELAAEAMRLSGARSLRWIPEGAMVTMDYRPDRLNIELDRENKVREIRCG